jgi:hypothetical protein
LTELFQKCPNLRKEVAQQVLTVNASWDALQFRASNEWDRKWDVLRIQYPNSVSRPGNFIVLTRLAPDLAAEVAAETEKRTATLIEQCNVSAELEGADEIARRLFSGLMSSMRNSLKAAAAARDRTSGSGRDGQRIATVTGDKCELAILAVSRTLAASLKARQQNLHVASVSRNPNGVSGQMTKEMIETAIHEYVEAMKLIVGNYVHGDRRIYPRDGDADQIHRIVFEVRDLISDHIPGATDYRSQIINYFNQSIANELSSPSLHGAKQILGLLEALETKVRRLPSELSEQRSDAGKSDELSGPKIFISHSSKDSAIVAALVTLLVAALHLRKADVRCTSVEGYKLPAGNAVSATLLEEILGAKTFVVVASKRSVDSAYVLFEMGARWAHGKPVVPIAIGSASAFPLPGPLGDLHVATGSSRSEILNIVERLADTLGVQLQAASGFDLELQKFCEIASQPVAMDGEQQPVVALPRTEKKPQMSEPANEILTAAAQSRFGQILMVNDNDGASIQAGEKEFGSGKTHREQMIFKQALIELTRGT